MLAMTQKAWAKVLGRQLGLASSNGKIGAMTIIVFWEVVLLGTQTTTDQAMGEAPET